jgi:hypothetical protein
MNPSSIKLVVDESGATIYVGMGNAEGYRNHNVLCKHNCKAIVRVIVRDPNNAKVSDVPMCYMCVQELAAIL